MSIVKVLVVPRNGQWAAVGLQVYVVGQGRTIDLALKDFERSFLVESMIASENGRSLEEEAGEAPEGYWELFQDSQTRRKEIPASSRKVGKSRRIELPKIRSRISEAFPVSTGLQATAR